LPHHCSLKKFVFFLDVTFLGCSEAKYEHKFGCDKDLDQPVEVRDMAHNPLKVIFKILMEAALQSGLMRCSFWSQ
jgi:hypothetical protein